MAPEALLPRRIANQRLGGTPFRRPEDVVAWFGAVQAQDYLGALWALGQRTRAATEASVEEALAQRRLIRCWPMRGTLHFIAADDARWITRLLAPRVIRGASAFWKRSLDLDARALGRARDVVQRALEGGKRLDRAGLYAALESRSIRCGSMRGQHLLLWLAMEGTLCITGRVGSSHLFALLDDWIPESRNLEGDAALAELARRYFSSHGPATLADFCWWAGITRKTALAGIDGAGDTLQREIHDDREWWSGAQRARIAQPTRPHVRLLPYYDEYTVAYQDRSMLVAPRTRLGTGFGLLSPVVLIDGQVVGNWKRRLAKGRVSVTTRLGRALSRPERGALERAIGDYTRFLGLATA
jgi:hypothetical protein